MNTQTLSRRLTAEALGTAALLATVVGSGIMAETLAGAAVPYAVGLFISAGYWFTASTSFANPAVTIARGFTNTFSGIVPGDAPAFIVAQLIGAVAATLVFGWLGATDNRPDMAGATDNGAEPGQ